MESEEENQKIFEKVWLIKFYKVPRGNRRKEAGPVTPECLRPSQKIFPGSTTKKLSRRRFTFWRPTVCVPSKSNLDL